MKRKRLVCIVEGKGEVRAIPNLCHRLLISLEISDWTVDEDPIRQPRNCLVDESQLSPTRSCRPKHIARAVQLALARAPTAIVILCDSDDDCAVTWAASANAVTTAMAPCPTLAVMAIREYEAWLLADEIHRSSRAPVDCTVIRGAKERLAQFVPGYMPTTHQLELTRLIDIKWLRSAAPSFDKFARTIDALCRPPAEPWSGS